MLSTETALIHYELTNSFLAIRSLILSKVPIGEDYARTRGTNSA